MNRNLLPALALCAMLAGCDGGEPTGTQQSAPPAPAQKPVSVHFVSPDDGGSVESPFHVRMAAEGVEVRPAGTMEEGTGHMHILVDAPFVFAGDVIPSDERHIHYGDGSTEATLDLEPGEHVLRLQFADGAHRALEGGEYRDMIRVTVQDSEAVAAPAADMEPEDDGGTGESGPATGHEEEPTDGSGTEEEGVG